MKKEFDFEQVGKKLPYKRPESYIENFKPVLIQKTQKGGMKISANMFTYAAAVTLLIISSIILLNPDMKDTVLPFEMQKEVISDFNSTDFEVIFKDFTDEELNALTVILETDLFDN